MKKIVMVLFGFIEQQLVGIFITLNHPIFSFEFAKPSTKNIRVRKNLTNCGGIIILLANSLQEQWAD